MRVAVQRRRLWIECASECLKLLVKEIMAARQAPRKERDDKRAEREAKRSQKDKACGMHLEGKVAFNVTKSTWVV